MEKRTYCDKCGTEMHASTQKGVYGGVSTIFACPRCYYRYEQGTRYNQATREYVKYYKFT